MDIVIGLLALVAFLAIPIAIGLGIGKVAQRKRAGKRAGFVASGQGWRQAPPNPQLLAIPLLRTFAGRQQLKEHFHVVGEHRGVPFDAVQYVRPRHYGEVGPTSASVVVVQRPVPGPYLRLKPRSGGWNPADSDGVPLGLPEFDQAMVLGSDDEQFARAAIHPGLASGLARDPRVQDTVIEFGPQHLVVFTGRQLNEENTRPLLDLLLDVHAAVPWQHLAGGHR